MAMNTPTDNPNRQGRRLRPYSALPQGFLRRPEVMRLSDKAKLLYWAMFDHACEQLTDGLIESVVLPMLYAVTGAAGSALAELAKGRIVKRDGADYQIVDFLEFSRSREDREGARTAAREKKKRQRRSDVPPSVPASVPQGHTGGPTGTEGEGEGEIEGESESKQPERPLTKKTAEADATLPPASRLDDDDGEIDAQVERLTLEDIEAAEVEDAQEAADAILPEPVEPTAPQVAPTPPAVGERVNTNLGQGEVTSCNPDVVYVRLDRDGAVHGFYPEAVSRIVPEGLA
jgi:hypothetical protein